MNDPLFTLPCMCDGSVYPDNTLKEFNDFIQT